MPLFDRYVAVDWSANNTPKLGADSIWAASTWRAEPGVAAANHATRRATESWLTAQLTAAVEAGDRILVGMDFPYGYPSGFAEALGLSGAAWRATWSHLTRHVIDDEKNRSNRFDVASQINLALGPRRPFWGRPAHLALPELPARKEVTYRGPDEVGALAEWREVERVLHSRGARPQPVWKLCYTGSVGSQTLLGIPALNRLRHHHTLRVVSRVWPFEMLVPDLPAGRAAIVHAEIWPSIVPFTDEPGSCNDERQVRAVVQRWRELDREDGLADLFAAHGSSQAVRGEEGWILGVVSLGAAQTVARAKPVPDPSEAKHPSAIPNPRVTPEPASCRPPCLCGCGNFPRGKRSRFMPGHDQRLNPATGRRFNEH